MCNDCTKIYEIYCLNKNKPSGQIVCHTGNRDARTLYDKGEYMIRILMLTMTVATLALSQGNMQGPGPHDKGMRGRGKMAEQLKLTDDQKKEFAKLRSGMEKSLITTRSKIQLARVDLRQMYAEAQPDRSKIEDKAREIGKLETDLKLARTGFWFDVNNILTAEQKTTWKKLPGMIGRQGRPNMWKMRGRMGPPMGYGSDGDEEMTDDEAD
jgi:Spy/CpxP family protein refolding chaperone